MRLYRDAVVFEPNRLNRAFTPNVPAIHVALGRIDDVSVKAAFLTSIITLKLSSPAGSLRLRCWRASSVAAQIEAVKHASSDIP
ncbi:hypothetical protein ACO2Q3_16880 [Caulobacter sp. KR2-114]|uniref:hypothetical protein n=1 Tax=Caulobacter sp. KR2-114 TaxID=3400912 RepID=UPI003BFC6A52